MDVKVIGGKTTLTGHLLSWGSGYFPNGLSQTQAIIEKDPVLGGALSNGCKVIKITDLSKVPFSDQPNSEEYCRHVQKFVGRYPRRGLKTAMTCILPSDSYRISVQLAEPIEDVISSLKKAGIKIPEIVNPKFNCA